jgi:folylpolyglutamate synthase/dihydropteroate synthase
MYCYIAVLQERAKEVNAPLFTVPTVLSKQEYFYQGFQREENQELRDESSIFADTEVLNTDIARAALHLLQRSNCDLFRSHIRFDSASIESCLEIRPPCRYEEFSVFADGQEQDLRVILDIAHNEDAIKALVRRTQLLFPQSSIRYIEYCDD